MKYKSLLLITLLIVATNLNAEDTLSEESIKLAQENAKPVTGEEKPKKVLRLTLKEAVQRSVEFNPTIRNSKYELVKYDSGFLKSESKYSWRLVGGADIVQGVLPYNQANILSGTRTQTNMIKRIKKIRRRRKRRSIGLREERSLGDVIREN